MKSKIMMLGLAAVLLFAVGCAGNKKSANLQGEIDRLNQEAQLKESELQKLNDQLAAVQAEVSRLQAEQDTAAEASGTSARTIARVNK